MKKRNLHVLLALVAILALAACGGSSESGGGQADTPLYVDAGQDSDIDWSLFPIIIDGQRGVAADWYTAPGEDFPTHIPLAPVAAALGVVLDIADSFPPEVSMEGRQGPITFTVGTYIFNIGSQRVDLWQPSLLVDGEIYVPIPFFRDVFGMGQAMWMGGHVHLNTEAMDDMH
ncbi:MAG: copper amine oxidase N-terminal domain-containing protein [Defluviitaleaceae bacterium]|nr:copper amine oxidase N-terminal domain-containing protein [Defluviitaleaceae bacterium]